MPVIQLPTAASNNSGTGTVASLSVTIPGKRGDLAVLVGNINAASGITAALSGAGGTGWTSRLVGVNSLSTSQLLVWTKILTSVDEGATLTMSPSAARNCCMALACFPAAAYESISARTEANATTGNNYASVTPAEYDDVEIGCWTGIAGTANQTRNVTAPVGFTELIEDWSTQTAATRSGVHICYKRLAGSQAVATGTAAWTVDANCATNTAVVLGSPAPSSGAFATA
jgi:hypothetical protein